ncbi:apolipoprotein N-acyltransferase [Marinitoga sp. 1155]|uniref:apolipoprotein N-acyltransferase n=1 Tax=Marinitoga sp. 1155 TaxID=1428448 RepID=UPI00064166DB|nr:apolipoprotein N-acyltransferase [Marinitoga sp. 1155]KLO24169.1 hypothetical protein X274_04850 [Marinitoga sp. 1155]
MFALVTGVFFYFSNPPFRTFFFIFYAFIPFFYYINNQLQKRKILLFSVLVSIMNSSFIFTSQIELKYKFAGFLSFVLIVTTLFYSFGRFVKKIENYKYKTYQKMFVISSFWLFEEYFSSKIFHGFTPHPGIALYNIGIFLFFSKYIGMMGLSFIIIATNYWLYYLLKNKKYKMFLIISLLILILPYMRINSQKDIMENKVKTIKLAIIQGNISSREYEVSQNNNELSYKIFKEYINLSLKSSKEYSPNIIIWPETAVHRWMIRLPNYRNKILEFVRENKANLIIGTPDLTPEDKEYNSIFIISKNGKIIGKYYKNKLVPYYEKVFEKGKELKIIDIEDLNIGFEICFEVVFPEITPELKNKGADVVIIASNNGMFGYSIVPYLMSAHGVFRAAENNIYIIQATNSGVSQIISPDGKILKSSKLYKKEIITYEIPIKKLNKTFYSKYGIKLYYLIFTIIIVILINNSALLKKQRKK